MLSSMQIHMVTGCYAILVCVTLCVISVVTIPVLQATESLILPYKQKYWRTLYLAVCSENAVGRILIWQISLPYAEKPMLVV